MSGYDGECVHVPRGAGGGEGEECTGAFAQVICSVKSDSTPVGLSLSTAVPVVVGACQQHRTWQVQPSHKNTHTSSLQGTRV